jgi:hypothetical protein
LSILVSFDFLQWPGFGCLTQFPYDTKVYVGTTAPFLFGILMWTPVLLLQCRLAWLPKECVTEEARDIKIDMKKKFRNTITSFWINILVWYEISRFLNVFQIMNLSAYCISVAFMDACVSGFIEVVASFQPALAGHFF